VGQMLLKNGRGLKKIFIKKDFVQLVG